MSDVLQSTISYAELRQVTQGVHAALAQTREEKCGKQMFAVRAILNRYGLSLEQAYELYFQNGTRQPEHREPEYTEQEQPRSDTLDDPTDWWVMPWAARMEREIGNNPRLEDKDLTLLVRMQEKRRKNLRAVKEIVWLRDVARRNRQTVPDEYFKWLDTVPEEEKRAAGVR